jgi:hypothetical protein
MPRLIDPWFDAEFYGSVKPCDADGRGGSWRHQGDVIEGAQGLFLWCPCGFGRPGFPPDGARPHGLIIPFSNPRNAPPVPADHGPFGKDKKTRPRWTMSGSCLNDLTLTPSVDVLGGKDMASCWHGFITNGEVK